MDAVSVDGAPEEAAGETLAALTLSRVPGLGPHGARRLVDRFGTARRALEACREESRERVSLPGDANGRRLSERVRAAARVVPDASRRELSRWREGGIRVIAYRSPGYPERLEHLFDPPPVLFLRGPAELSASRTVAIIGARRATEYGRTTARRLAGELGRAGCTVVSGMALGVDAAAHRGALESGAVTIGVLGCGVDRAYPPGNGRLYAEVGRRGLLVSEFEPGTKPRAAFFPRRNRIIAALANAVVVVQAGGRSGTSITVGQALDLGREVFGIPGRVDQPASVGVHRLLRQGGRLITCAHELLEDLGWPEEAEPPLRQETERGSPDQGPSEREPTATAAILDRLGRGTCGRDELAAESGLPVHRALALLGRLELQGRITSLAGGRYALF